MSLIGEAIKRERKLAGMTSKALAERIMTSPQYLNDIEHGRRDPSVATLLTITNQFPDVDSAEWLWMLLRQQWGDAVTDVMHKYATTTTPQGGDQEDGRRE